VTRAVDNATRWVLDKGYRNVIVEINNECNVRYDHADPSVRPGPRADRAREAVERGALALREHLARRRIRAAGQHRRGLGLRAAARQRRAQPERMVEMIRQVRAMDVYTPMPIVNNEDDQPWRVASRGGAKTGTTSWRP
jgi:hypothetical protein